MNDSCVIADVNPGSPPRRSAAAPGHATHSPGQSSGLPGEDAALLLLEEAPLTPAFLRQVFPPPFAAALRRWLACGVWGPCLPQMRGPALSSVSRSGLGQTCLSTCRWGGVGHSRSMSGLKGALAPRVADVARDCVLGERAPGLWQRAALSL